MTTTLEKVARAVQERRIKPDFFDVQMGAWKYDHDLEIARAAIQALIEQETIALSRPAQNWFRYMSRTKTRFLWRFAKSRANGSTSPPNLHSPIIHSRLEAWLPAQPRGPRMTTKQAWTWGAVIAGIAALGILAALFFYPEAASNGVTVPVPAE